MHELLRCAPSLGHTARCRRHRRHRHGEACGRSARVGRACGKSVHGGAHGEGVRQICTGALVCGRSACVCAHGAACGKSARSVRSLGRHLHRHVASVVAVVVVAHRRRSGGGRVPAAAHQHAPNPASTRNPLQHTHPSSHAHLPGTHTSLARTPPLSTHTSLARTHTPHRGGCGGAARAVRLGGACGKASGLAAEPHGVCLGGARGRTSWRVHGRACG